MEFENEWWLRKCAKEVLRHNFLLQNGKIFQYSWEAYFLVKRHGCCFIYEKCKTWNLWALTHQPLFRKKSVTIFGFPCHLKIKVFGPMARTWVDIMIGKRISHVMVISIPKSMFATQDSCWSIFKTCRLKNDFFTSITLCIFTKIITSPEN